MQNISNNFLDFNKTLGALNKTLAVAGAGVAATGFALIKLGKNAFSEAARVQELDIAMQAIGKSTGIGYKAINEATNAIRKNGIEMAASQQIAIEFAQNNLEIAKASKVARVAQDLAVIGAKNSTETTLLLTRAIITGRTELLKSSGIQKSAGQMYEEFAQKAGKSATALTAVEKQTAVLNGVLAEGTKVAGTYEAAMTAPGKVLRSFPRIINDISVELGKSVTVGFAPVISETYNFIRAISKALRESSSFQTALGALGVVFTNLTNPLTNTLRHLTDMVKNIKFSDDAVVNFTMKFKEFLPVISAVSVALSAFAGQSLLRGIPMLSGFAGALNPIMAGFIALVATSPELRREVVSLLMAFKPLIPVILQIGNYMATALINILRIVIPMIRGFADMLNRFIPSALAFMEAHKGIARALELALKALTLLATAIFAYAKITALFKTVTSLFMVGALKDFVKWLGISRIATFVMTGSFTALAGSASAAAVGITGAAIALRVFRAALVSTGIGILLVALGFAAEKLLSFVDGSNKASDSTKELDQFSKQLETQMKNLQKQFQLDLPNAFSLTAEKMDEATQQMEEQKQKAKELADRIKELKKNVSEAVESFGKFVAEQQDTRTLAVKNAQAFESMNASLKNTKLTSDELLGRFRELTSTLQENFSTALSNARSQLQDAKNAFDEFKNTISTSIKRIVNFEKAVEGGDFLKGLIEQAGNATKFSDKVKQLISMGLSQSAITQIVESGFEVGTTIADQIIAGGQTVVDQVNNLIASVETVADAVGFAGAQKFYQAGVDYAQNLVNGIIDQMNQSYSAVQAMVDKLNEILASKARAEQIAATTTIGPSAPKPKVTSGGGKGSTAQNYDYNKYFLGRSNVGVINPQFPTITSANIMGRVPKLAEGGIVTRPTLAMIGEKGPEAVVPLNKAGGGAVYNITVNAGIGTSGQEVGRQIVEAIKKFERSSGPVFAKA